MQKELKNKTKKVDNPIFKGIKRNWFTDMFINLSFKKIISKWLEEEWVCPYCLSEDLLLWHRYQKSSTIEKKLRDIPDIMRFFTCNRCKNVIINFEPVLKWNEYPLRNSGKEFFDNENIR